MCVRVYVCVCVGGGAGASSKAGQDEVDVARLNKRTNVNVVVAPRGIMNDLTLGSEWSVGEGQAGGGGLGDAMIIMIRARMGRIRLGRKRKWKK